MRRFNNEVGGANRGEITLATRSTYPSHRFWSKTPSRSRIRQVEAERALGQRSEFGRDHCLPLARIVSEDGLSQPPLIRGEQLTQVFPLLVAVLDIWYGGRMPDSCRRIDG